MSGHLNADVLSAYLDRELVGGEEARVEGHLVSCDRCQQRLDGLRRVVAKLHAVESVSVPPFIANAMPHRISLEDRPASLLDRFENRLKRLYVPRATIPLIFALVMALALIVYLFSWGAYRSQQPVEPVVIAPGALGAAATSSMGERSFILEGRRWRQQSLEGSEGRPVATSSEEGRRIVEAESQLEALLANGRSVLLSWQGEAVELGD